jgi:hypothetical protein
MAENDGGDYRITLAEQIFGRVAAIPEDNPPEPREPTLPLIATSDSAVSQRSPPDALNAESSEGVKRQKELKTAVELARMIEVDLAGHPDCPEAGFRVTVYGWPHWRAMLTIAPAAGRVRDPYDLDLE